MRFVVNGASGFVGTALIRYLATKGWAGTAVSRQSMETIPEGWAAVSRQALLEQSPGTYEHDDCLVHLEVKHHVPRPQPEDERAFYDVNVGGLETWLDWCERGGVQRVVLFSSIKAVRAREGVQDEGASGPGDTPYGASKWEAEALLRRWVASDDRRSSLIVRPAVIYGPGNRANMFAFVSAIARNRYILVGKNANLKSVVSLANVVHAVEFLTKRMKKGVETYNLVDRESYSVAELAALIQKELGKTGGFLQLPPWLAAVGARLGDIIEGSTGKSVPLTSARLKAVTEASAFSADKLVKTGFRHPQTTEEGLRELVNWYLSGAK